MGNTIGQRRTNENNPCAATPNIAVSKAEHSDGDSSDSDRENQLIADIFTPDDPSPNVSLWETPDMAPAHLKSQHIMSLIDPRSPCEDINRTPILVGDAKDKEKQGKKRNRPLNLNQEINKVLASNEIQSDGDASATPDSTTTGLPPNFDPRSPTNDIDRTPIGPFRAMSLKDNPEN